MSDASYVDWDRALRYAVHAAYGAPANGICHALALELRRRRPRARP